MDKNGLMLAALIAFSAYLPVNVFAQSQEENRLGREIAADISGQAAGGFTYHVMQCANLDKLISQAQLAAAKNTLSAERSEHLQFGDIWDQAFKLGQVNAAAKKLVYNDEHCAEALQFLKGQ